MFSFTDVCDGHINLEILLFHYKKELVYRIFKLLPTYSRYILKTNPPFPNRDGKLNLDEFRVICKALFRNDKGHIYPLSEERARHIFQVFDKNGDGFIDKEEFTFCWNHWIKVVSFRGIYMVDSTLFR